MIDSNFLAFSGVAALLVLSPGATMVVVADAAIESGRRAALWTVAGIGAANGSMALASAFGLAAIVHRVPVVLTVMSVVGTVYLAWLGARAVWRALRRDGEGSQGRTELGHGASRFDGPTAPRASRGTDVGRRVSSAARFGRGLLTNYANPSVVLFYTVIVPQFITPHYAFLPRYLLLGGTHVAMSVVWQGIVGVSVGTFARRMAQPSVRRGMDLAMGAALLAFAVKIGVSIPR